MNHSSSTRRSQPFRRKLALLFAWLGIALFCFGSQAQAQNIFIDPGHGGDDLGGSSNSVNGKEVTLQIAQELKRLLDADTLDTTGGGEWTTRLSRSEDIALTAQERAVMANQGNIDLFLSISLRDSPTGGTQTFSYGDKNVSSEEGLAFRNLIHEEVLNEIGLTDLGAEEANFPILQRTSMPAVLVEVGSLTSTTDAAVLTSSVEQKNIAFALLRAIQRHHGKSPHRPGAANVPTATLLFTFTSSENHPVPGVRLQIDGVEQLPRSDANGVLRVEGIAPGPHFLSAKARDHLPYEIEVDLLATKVFESEVKMEFSLDPCDPNIMDCEGVNAGCSTSSSQSPTPLLWLATLLLFFLLRKSRIPTEQ